MIKLLNSLLKKNVLLLASCILALCLVVSWLLYVLFGHYLITSLYESDGSWIVDTLMDGRKATPLKDYHQEADRLMVTSTIKVIALSLALAILLGNPRGALIACCSFFLMSVFLFIAFELFPHLIKPFQLHSIDYYAYRANYIPDGKLIYRENPLVQTKILNFRGSRYSPVYNLEVHPTIIDWATDEEGFRNRHVEETADIVVIGDSFIEYGDNENDTFVSRLEKSLPGFKVANLGKSGYGPFQYLEVLERYGLNKKPKYALLSFFEGNDFGEIKDYLEFGKGDRNNRYGEIYDALTGNFFKRYRMAFTGVIDYAKKQRALLVDLHISKLWKPKEDIHPRIAVVDVGGKSQKMYLGDMIGQKLPEEILKAEEVRGFRDILIAFKALCEHHHITPIILYIPTETHIYAQYSTLQSGKSWLNIRDEQMPIIKSIEKVFLNIAQEVEIEVINLTPFFEGAAKQGQMLFYALDSHWNAEGRELAAASVAKILKDKFLPPPSSEVKK